MEGDRQQKEGKKVKLLFSGLGGGKSINLVFKFISVTIFTNEGLDVINASILYFLAKHNGVDAALGSARPVPLSNIENSTAFSKNGTLLTGNFIHFCAHQTGADTSFCMYVKIAASKILQKGRYIEPRVAEELQEQVS